MSYLRSLVQSKLVFMWLIFPKNLQPRSKARTIQEEHKSNAWLKKESSFAPVNCNILVEIDKKM